MCYRERLKKLLSLVVCVIACVTTTGCDPGYRMRPEGVSLVDGTWSASLVGVTLVGRPLGGLIGETWLDNEFHASNDTDADFHIDEAELLVGGRSTPMKREGVDPN
jgi:hypothetical protein